MIRDWNVDSVFSQFARNLIAIALNQLNTATSVSVGSVIMNCAGKILSVKANVAQVSGSIETAIRKNGSNISTASLTTTGVLSYTLSSETFADGDVLDVVINSVDTEIIRGGVTFEVRPLLDGELTAPNTNS